MTLATTTIDLLIADIFREYLEDTATGQADAAIAKELMDGIAEPTRPVIILTAKEEPVKSSPRREITLNPVLCTWAKSEEAGAAANENQTTRTTASAIMAAIESRLRDADAFQTWLSALDSTRRDGWSILKITHEGQAPLMRPDASSRSVLYSLTMKLHLHVSRVA